jgi:mono/diheme cytochrome c family protein
LTISVNKVAKEDISMLQIIRKRFLMGLTLLFGVLLLAVPAVLAGGWTVTTLDALPTEVVAGQPLQVSFMIRQHGRHPWVYDQVMVHATHLRSQEKISVQARAKGRAGHYVASLKFPQAGTWRWDIEAGMMPLQQPMPDLVVLEAGEIGKSQVETSTSVDSTLSSGNLSGGSFSMPLGIGIVGGIGTIGTLLFWLRTRTPIALMCLSVTAVVAAVGFGLAANSAVLADDSMTRLPAQPAQAASTTSASVEMGQALFVAKGCIVCHRHEAVREVRKRFGNFEDFSVGPDLPSLVNDPKILHTWLKDPAAVKPNTQMPNLELKKTEIEALVAFLLNRKPNAEEAASPTDSQAAGSASVKIERQPAELFFIRAEGAKGPLVAYDMANNLEQFRLPPGIPAADGSAYFAAVVQQNSTMLQVFKANSSHLERRFTLPGRWALSGVAPTGRWLALTRLPSQSEEKSRIQAKQWQTEVQIVDAASGETAHLIKLDGNFEVETISAAGDALFLIEYLPAINPTQYAIRLYDLAAERLQPEALRAKTAEDKLMTGLAWGGVASADGRWLLTLYLNTSRNVAFIHALNLVDKFPLCIDLPSGDGDFDQLKYYALTLAPDGRTVYAANAALGVVAEVSLDSFQVTHQVKFPASAPDQPDTSTPTNYSVLSKDGQMLYFSSGWDVWGYELESGEVSGPYLSHTPIKGLGLSTDNQRLFVATDKQPLVLDLANEGVLSFKAP